MQKIVEKLKQISELRIFSYLILFSFLLWLTLLLLGDILQANLFFGGIIPCDDLFADFLKPLGYFKGALTFENLPESIAMWVCYTPFTFLIYGFFLKLSVAINPQLIYATRYLVVSFCLSFLMLFQFLIILKYLKSNVRADKVILAFAVILSGIYLFTFERANIILLAVLLSTFFIFNYDSEKKYLKELAIISLSVAVALKFSPAILGMLFVYKKDYKGLCKAILYSAALILLPSLFFSQGLETLLTVKENLSALSLHVINHPEGGRRFLNIFINTICILFHLEIPSKIFLTHLFTGIIAALGVFSLAASFFYKAFWKKVLLLVLLMILLPAVSFKYNLLYLIPVLILFFNRTYREKYDNYYLFCFILIFCCVRFHIFGIILNDFLMDFIKIAMFFMLTLYSVKMLKKRNEK